MENLPFLVLEKIFSELTNLNEVIKCSLVCRNWRAAYEAFKPTTLCLYSESMPLNHRLVYSTERVRRCQSFEVLKDLLFLSFEITKTHFANIRKLVIFGPISGFETKYHPFSFRRQLNHFKKLEHLEIHQGVNLGLKDSELDLPMLKVLCFNARREWRKEEMDEEFDEGTDEEMDEESEREWTEKVSSPEVVLNTPSLEVFEVQSSLNEGEPFSEFVFKFPHQLRSLTAFLDTSNLDSKTKFERLECLVVSITPRKLRDDFLSFFPNLKLLLPAIDEFYKEDADDLHKKLMEQKKRYRLDDLEVLMNHNDRFSFYLDHKNWREYVRHEKIVQCYPINLTVDFNQVVEHAVPLNYFKSFFRIDILTVGMVADQKSLLDFLRIVRTCTFLEFDREFNLGVDFFNEVAGYLSVYDLELHESTLNRLSDYTFFEKFNFCKLSLDLEHLPREAVSAALKKPDCYIVFLHFKGRHRPLSPYIADSHTIQRHPVLGFFCEDCLWTSTRDLEPNSDPIESTLRHLGKGMRHTNITCEELEELEA